MPSFNLGGVLIKGAQFEQRKALIENIPVNSYLTKS